MNNTNNKTRNANGEGTIYYDTSINKWRCQISYTTPTGERKRKSVTGKNKTEVRNKKKKFLEDLALGRITETSDCTIVDLLKEQAEYDLKVGIIQESAYVRRYYTIHIIEKYSIGNTPICKLNEARINDFFVTIKSKYSNSVISKVYSSLRLAYKIAINKRLLTYNIMDSPFIKKPKADRPDRVVRAFTCEEQKIFLEALKQKRYRAENIDYNTAFLIQLFTGMRCGEVLALEVDDIDLEANYIHIKRTITRGIEYEVKVGKTTKTASGVRDVPIHPLLVEPLKKLLDNYVENKDHLLFYNTKADKPICTQQANSYFHRLCNKVGLQAEGGTHILRHTFITRCAEAGVTPEVVMRWVGHQDIRVTLNIYTDVSEERHQDGLDKFTQYCNESICA